MSLKKGQVRQFWSRDGGVERTAELLILSVSRHEVRFLVLATELPHPGWFWIPPAGHVGEVERDTMECGRVIA